MPDLAAILLVGAGTYASRAIFILALANRKIPEAVLVSLQFVAPAVLAALIVTLLIDSDGNVAIGIPEAAAFVAGGLVAWRSRNHTLTLVVGMGVFWLIRAFLQ